MEDVYRSCPYFENDNYLLRLISRDDCNDLLNVYSDTFSLPLFNSDNCNGDDFHYETYERMLETVNFWIFSYENKYFVRLTIIDKKYNKAIGTIELFHRKANDYFNDFAILRLDLKSEYEKKEIIINIISLIFKSIFNLFNCNSIATKIIPLGTERRKAFEEINFKLSENKIIGRDGKTYDSYFEFTNENIS